MPLSIRRGSTFAWNTPSVQPRQAYLGRTVRSTLRIAGITSSTSLTSSPILWLALAARAGGRLRLQHLLTARQVLGQRADVAARLLAWLIRRLRRRRIVVGSRRRGGAGLKVVKLKRELLGHERGKPLRALAEDHFLERLHRYAQLLVLSV